MTIKGLILKTFGLGCKYLSSDSLTGPGFWRDDGQESLLRRQPYFITTQGIPTGQGWKGRPWSLQHQTKGKEADRKGYSVALWCPNSWWAKMASRHAEKGMKLIKTKPLPHKANRELPEQQVLVRTSWDTSDLNAMSARHPLHTLCSYHRRPYRKPFPVVSVCQDNLSSSITTDIWKGWSSVCYNQ